MITSVIWIVFALFGVIPFMLGHNPLSFTDAVFEVISGLTTTGASMISDVEALPHGLLFWRALTQWIGGLGIVLFMLAVLPELNKATGISMFQAEATGITHDKI
ncbi:MAG: TrkH family potassium uptake protein, partial [Duncaniella sp.]|nr:TrkH family potassium uptake protein [Duncaniella sp.]